MLPHAGVLQLVGACMRKLSYCSTCATTGTLSVKLLTAAPQPLIKCSLCKQSALQLVGVIVLAVPQQQLLVNGTS